MFEAPPRPRNLRIAFRGEVKVHHSGRRNLAEGESKRQYERNVKTTQYVEKYKTE